jgi:hypothetical protein
MPLIQAQPERVTVHFDNGETLTFKMRPDAVTVDTARRLGLEARRADMVESRVKRLQEKVKSDNLDATEFERVLKELKQLELHPDQLSLMANFIMLASEGWEDYFMTLEDERAGKVIPFTKEQIEKIHPAKLNRIIESFNQYFGYGAEESKKSSGNLLSTSLTPPQE